MASLVISAPLLGGLNLHDFSGAIAGSQDDLTFLSPLFCTTLTPCLEPAYDIKRVAGLFGKSDGYFFPKNGKTYEDYLESFRLSPYGMTDPPSREQFLKQLHFFREIELLAEDPNWFWDPKSLFFPLIAMNYEEYFANRARETETERNDSNAEILLKWRQTAIELELKSPADVLMFVYGRLKSIAKTEEERVVPIVKKLARALIPDPESSWGTLCPALITMVTGVYGMTKLSDIKGAVDQFLEELRPVCLEGCVLDFSEEGRAIYVNYLDKLQIQKSYDDFSSQEIDVLHKLVFEITRKKEIHWKDSFPNREQFEFLLAIEAEAIRFKQVESIPLMELIENIGNYSLLYIGGGSIFDYLGFVLPELSEEEYHLFREGFRKRENLMAHYLLHLMGGRFFARHEDPWVMHNPVRIRTARERVVEMENRIAFSFELLKRHIVLSMAALAEAMRDKERNRKVAEIDPRVTALEAGAPVQANPDIFEKIAILILFNRMGLRISEAMLTEWLEICEYRDFSGTIPEEVGWDIHQLQVTRQPEVQFDNWKKELGEILAQFHKNNKNHALENLPKTLQDCGEYRCLKTLEALERFYNSLPQKQRPRTILDKLNRLKEGLTVEKTGKVTLRLKPSRTVLDAFAAKIAANSLGVIWGKLADGFIRYALTDKHYHPYRIYIDGHWSGTLMSHTYENKRDSNEKMHRRILILHGIELKTDDLLHPEDFMTGLRDRFRKAAKKAGYDLVLLPKSPKTQTNMKHFFRPEIPLLGLREICFPEGFYFPKVGPTEKPEDSYNSASRYLWSTRKPEDPIEPHQNFWMLWSASEEDTP